MVLMRLYKVNELALDLFRRQLSPEGLQSWLGVVEKKGQ